MKAFFRGKILKKYYRTSSKWETLNYWFTSGNTCKNKQKNCTKKALNVPDNHDGVVFHLESDIPEREVKRALGSITMNKASGGDGIPVELFQILKDNAVKVLH